jgi:MFS family permease
VVWHNALLRAVVLIAPLINFAFTGVIFSITVSLRQHGVAPGIIGLTQAGIMVGGLLGAIVAPKLQGRLPLWQLTMWLTAMAAVLFAVAAFVLPSPLVAVPIAITLVLSPAGNAALFATMLRVAPEDMRGRVTSTVVQAATALAALSPLTAGLIVQHLSGQWAIGAFAATVGVGAIMCAGPWLRRAEVAAARSVDATEAAS